MPLYTMKESRTPLKCYGTKVFKRLDKGSAYCMKVGNKPKKRLK